MLTLDLVSSTNNNPSLHTTTSHNHQCPLLSPPTTITNHPSPRQHTPTMMTMRWQLHITSTQQLDEHNAVLTAHGNDDMPCQQYVPHHPDTDEASRWAAPTPFLFISYLTWQMATTWHINQHAVSYDSHDSAHPWTNSTTTCVYKPPKRPQLMTTTHDYNNPKPNGCHGPQRPPWPNDHHHPWPSVKTKVRCWSCSSHTTAQKCMTWLKAVNFTKIWLQFDFTKLCQVVWFPFLLHDWSSTFRWLWVD